jgi:hypothetical protein
MREGKDLSIALVIISGMFGIVAMMLLALGLRGNVRFTPPRCACCGYDLRTIDLNDVAMKTCPECGAALVYADAINFGVRVMRHGMLLAGLSVLTASGAAFAIWYFLPSPPAAVVVRQGAQTPAPKIALPSPILPPAPATTQNLLAQLKENPNDRGTWSEIRTRIENGSLSAAELDSVVTILTNAVKASNDPKPHMLLGELEFALRAPAVHERLSPTAIQKYYEATTAIPKIISRRRANQTNVPFMYQYSPIYSALKGSVICLALRQIKGDNGKILFPPAQATGSSRVDADRVSDSSVFSGIGHQLVLHGPFDTGDHEFEFMFDFGVVAEGTVFHGAEGKPGTKDKWPHPLCTWERTVRHTFTIVPDDQPVMDAITDPARDPFKTFDFGITDVVVRSINGDRKDIVIRWNPNERPSIPLSYQILVDAGGSTIDFGSLGGVEPRMSMPQEWHRPVPSRTLGDEVESIGIHFVVDPRVAAGSIACEQYWNVPHDIPNIKLRRDDLVH